MTDATKYTSKLHNARILIIGGSSGIGFCVAEACLESGAANVAIASSNRDRLGRAVASLKASYPSASHKVFGAPVDLSNAETLEGELKTLLDATAEGMGGAKLDHVVFTAGDALAVGGLEDMVRFHPFRCAASIRSVTLGLTREGGLLSLFQNRRCPRSLPRVRSASLLRCCSQSICPRT